MRFEAKIRNIGTSLGIIIPASVLKEERKIKGDIIILYTSPGEKETADIIMPKIKAEALPIKKPFNANWCSKHSVYKGTCGCN